MWELVPLAVAALGFFPESLVSTLTHSQYMLPYVTSHLGGSAYLCHSERGDGVRG